MQSIGVVRDEPRPLDARLTWLNDSAELADWHAVMTLVLLVLVPVAWYALMFLLVFGFISSVEGII